MGAIIGWAVGNPLMILGVIAAITLTSWVSDVRSWYQERAAVHQAVKPWIEATKERDQAAKLKDQIAENAAKEKDDAEQELEALKAEYTAHLTNPAGGCDWNDDDLRLLNRTKAK